MKTLASESLFNKVAGLQLYYKEAPAQVFSYEYCEIFRNTYTWKHLSTAAWEGWTLHFQKVGDQDVVLEKCKLLEK